MPEITQCGARTRAGTPCRKPAGWGTDHRGHGRCKLHGGASPRGPDSPHYKHGKRCRPPLPDAHELEEFAETFDPLDLSDEALLASYFARKLAAQRDVLECPECGAKVPLEVPAPVFWRAINVAGLTKKRQADVQQGQVIKYIIDVAAVDPFIDALVEALRREVRDPDERARVIDAVLAVGGADDDAKD